MSVNYHSVLKWYICTHIALVPLLEQLEHSNLFILKRLAISLHFTQSDCEIVIHILVIWGEFGIYCIS